MLKSRFLVAWLLVLVFCTAGRLAAEDKATDLIPAKTLAVVRIKKPTELLDKGANFLDALQPGTGNIVRKQREAIGYLIDNPTLSGVSTDESWWIAVEDDSERGDISQPLFVVPLLKGHEDDLPKALGDNYQFARKGSWGVYSKRKPIFEEVQKLVKGEGKSLTPLIDEPSAKIFSDGDVAVFLNLSQFITDHKADLDRAREQITRELAREEDRAEEIPGINRKAAFQAFGLAVRSILQCIEDTRSCVIGIQLDKQGIRFDDLVRVKESSPSDKFLSEVPTSPITALNRLPAGNQVYFGAHVEVTQALKLATTILGAPIPGKEKASTEIKRIIEELSKLKFGSMAGGLKAGSLKEGGLLAVRVAEVDAPDKVRPLTQKMFEVFGDLSTGAVKQTFKFEADAEKYGSRTADLLTVTMKVDDPEISQRLSPLMKIINGADGSKTRIAYLKDRVVQATGEDRQLLADVIAGQEKTSDDAGSPVAKARGELPANANFVLLLDLPGLIRSGTLLAIEAGTPIPIPPATFEGVKLKETYLAASLGAEKQGFRGRLYLPIEQIQGLVRLALPLGLIDRLPMGGR